MGYGLPPAPHPLHVHTRASWPVPACEQHGVLAAPHRQQPPQGLSGRHRYRDICRAAAAVLPSPRRVFIPVPDFPAGLSILGQGATVKSGRGAGRRGPGEHAPSRQRTVETKQAAG